MTRTRFAPPNALVLISYSVAHDMGSEPGVGWQFLLAAEKYARLHSIPLHLVTNGRSAAKLDDWCARHPGSLRHVRHVLRVPAEERLQGRWERLAYLIWTFKARRQVRRLVAMADGSCAVHQVTFASEVLPVSLPQRRPVTCKSIWGPVRSSGAAWIYKVGPQNGQLVRARQLQGLRDRLAKRLATRNARRADLVLLQSSSVSVGRGPASFDTRVFPNFVPSPDFAKVRRTLSSGPRLQLLSVGQLIVLKRVDLAIRALAEAPLEFAELTVLGAGPQRQRLVELAADLGVDSRVKFLGEVTRQQVVRALEQSDVLVHLSAREGASGAVAEASMVGLPVVCIAGTGAASALDYGGGGGVVVQPDPLPSVRDIASCIHTAAHLGMPPVRTWDAKRLPTFIEEIYQFPGQA